MTDEQTAAELEPDFRILKVNGDEEQPLMAKFGSTTDRGAVAVAAPRSPVPPLCIR